MSKTKVLMLLAAPFLASFLILTTRVASVSRNDVLRTQSLDLADNTKKDANYDVALLPHNESSAALNDEGEIEVITATAGGIEPQTLTRPRGPFVLAVHNMSGGTELELRIARVQGERLHELRLRAGMRSQHARLNLPPGDYIISEAGHPDWSCALTITN